MRLIIKEKTRYSNFTRCVIVLLVILPYKNIFAQNIETFFNKKDLMQVGSYYYPEQWPESNWERDIKMMADLGFEFTHYGEFAWSTMEPEEGNIISNG